MKVETDFLNQNRRKMEKLFHILLDPLRSSSRKERLTVALALMTIAFGFLVLTVNEIVVYVLSLVLLYFVAKLVKETSGEEEDA